MIIQIGSNKWTVGLKWSCGNKKTMVLNDFGVKYTIIDNNEKIINVIGTSSKSSNFPSAAYTLYKYKKNCGIKAGILYIAKINENYEGFWLTLINSNGVISPKTDIVNNFDDTKKIINELSLDFDDLVVLFDDEVTKIKFSEYNGFVTPFDYISEKLSIEKYEKIKKINPYHNLMLILLIVIFIVSYFYHSIN